MARLVEAELALDAGKEADGLTALHTAFTLAKQGGYLSSRVWQPNVMGRLCICALKAGIEVEYVRGLIRKRHLVPSALPLELESWPWPITIKTLGFFEVLQDGRQLRFSRKLQRRPLTLLKLLIIHGPHPVREADLIEALWPDAEGDAAAFALTTTVHRLRRLLDQPTAVLRSGGKIVLNIQECWVDAWAADRLLEQAEKLPAARTDSTAWDTIRERTERAFALHRGDFLATDPDLPGSAATADRLRHRLLRQLVRVGQHSETHGKWEDAANWYERGFQLDPCVEDVCRRLMLALHRLGRRSEVSSIFQRCATALAARLAATPSPETVTTLESLVR
jgi:DNA-binding SARP family transcriptional activator